MFLFLVQEGSSVVDEELSRYVLASMDGTSCHNVPEIFEYNDIHNNREEILSSVVASSYPHMMDKASCIPIIDNQSEILVNMS